MRVSVDGDLMSVYFNCHEGFMHSLTKHTTIYSLLLFESENVGVFR